MSLRYVNKRRLYLLNRLRHYSNKYDAPIWRRVRELLDRPKRRRVVVNIYKINRYTEDGDLVVVPGKVVGSGTMDHKVVVGAFDYSLNAREKLRESGCEPLLLEEFLERYPDGRGVKIII